ncbi:glycosyltransferase family 2 protein [Zymobacter palmae]|nr:glycosyltransferase family A protein [Zymobacter palmae]
MNIEKIIVAIPVYNKANVIGGTLNSLLKQTSAPNSVFIVDDGSTDNSLEEIYKYKKKFENLGVSFDVFKQKNGGVSSARNRAIIESPKDSLICFLDADDHWENEYLEYIRKAVSLYPGQNIFASAYRIKKSSNNTIDKTLKNTSEICVINYNDLKSVGEFPYFPSSFCAHKSVFCDNKIFFPESQKIGEDISCFFMLSILNNTVFVNKPLVTYNIDTEGNTASSNNPMDFPEIVGELEGKNEYKRYLLQEKDKEYHDYLLNFYLKSCWKNGLTIDMKKWCFSWKNNNVIKTFKGFTIFLLAIFGKRFCLCSAKYMIELKLFLKRIKNF